MAAHRVRRSAAEYELVMSYSSCRILEEVTDMLLVLTVEEVAIYL